jgi:hypothetical protein
MVFYYDYPAPDEVLRIGPVRNIAAKSVPPSAQEALLEKRVLKEMRRQTLSGR